MVGDSGNGEEEFRVFVRFMERLDVERRPWFCPDGSEPDTSPSALGLHAVGSSGVEP
ncbi:MAG: hypothetical protein ACR2G7_08815 [Acidimicrobiales bacterium]